MNRKIQLGKKRDSRTRGKEKAPEQSKKIKLQQSINPIYTSFVNYLLSKDYSTSTIEQLLKYTTRFLQWIEAEKIPIEQITYNDILHYIQSKRKNVTQKTIAVEVNSLKHYFNYLINENTIAINPTNQIQIKGIKRKILYDILSKVELESLYKSVEVTEDNNHKDKNQNWFKTSLATQKRNKIIVGLLIYQGLNTSEIQALQLEDIKLREGKIYIAGSRRSQERTLALEAHQIMDIMEYQLKIRAEILQLTGKESKQFFVSTGTGEKLHNSIQCLVASLQKQNKKVKNLQQIRASVITHWLKIYNLREVQYRAGHRYISSTESYIINDIEDLVEEVAKYHPLA